MIRVLTEQMSKSSSSFVKLKESHDEQNMFFKYCVVLFRISVMHSTCTKQLFEVSNVNNLLVQIMSFMCNRTNLKSLT